MDSRTQQVAQLLRQVGEAHHQAFAATNGDDPEWPLWYTERLLQPLSQLIGFNFTRSELVYVLVLLSKGQPGPDWPTTYAEYILENYPKR